jgi:hypothetical protein
MSNLLILFSAIVKPVGVLYLNRKGERIHHSLLRGNLTPKNCASHTRRDLTGRENIKKLDKKSLQPKIPCFAMGGAPGSSVT